jgi:ribonuclease PH
MRSDERAAHALRPVRITPGFLTHNPGSVLIEFGQTRVLCAATVEEKVPPFRLASGGGWLTAEYSLLPASTSPRAPREAARGKLDGRTYEIQRLIGRSLRLAVDLDRLGPRTLWIDCDVIQADGGTRTAAITGGYVATALAIAELHKAGLVGLDALIRQIAAVSVGVVGGVVHTDLCYTEDSSADVDMNVVMARGGALIEVQGTAEGAPFDRPTHDHLLDAASAAIDALFNLQDEALAQAGVSMAVLA